MSDDKYKELRRVVTEAIERAASGKGKERHANDNAFEDQQICQIPKWQGSIDGLTYQINKKAIETKRMSKEAAIKELQDVIVYAGAAIIVREWLP